MTKWMTVVLAAAALTACGDKDGDTGGSDLDTTTADTVWADMSGYDSWNQVTDWEGVVASEDGTHGAYVQIWANDAAYDVISAGAGGDLPAGAILVKEGYSDEAGSELSAVTVMAKIDGYAPDSGDWFYGRYDDAGTASVASADGGCQSCHSSGQDYVRFTTW